jgi:hypothetical protein
MAKDDCWEVAKVACCELAKAACWGVAKGACCALAKAACWGVAKGACCALAKAVCCEVANMACCKQAKVDSGKVAKDDCCKVAKGDSRDMAKGDCCNLVPGKAPGFWDTKTNCCPGKDVVRKVGGVPGVRGKQFANPAAGTASGWPKVGPGVRGEAGRTGLKENRPGVAGAADDTRLSLFFVSSCERGCQQRGQKFT